jgi:glycosyltransferase involved in cell wall biosynthesis
MAADEQVEIVAQREGSGRSRVTVAVSLYNYRDFIVSCLESVRAQTISDLDLVIVDDCSSDGGDQVACEWLDANGGRFDRHALLRHRTNCGLSGARNTAFAYARTEYMFVLDADNLLYPRCLQQLIGSLDNCTASFAYTYLEKFGGATGLHNIQPWNPATLQHGNTVDAMVMLRRSVWEAVGGYSTDMPNFGWEDFDLWFKIAQIKGWGVQVPEILGRYCVHRDSMLRTVTNPHVDRLWTYFRSKYPEFFSRQTD